VAKGLTKDQIQMFGKALTTLRHKLVSQDEGSAGWRAPVELDQQSVGRLSRMDAMQQQAMSDAEARRRQIDLKRIDAALTRIDADEFGWCLECGEGIAIKRLEVDPMATLCVGCAK